MHVVGASWHQGLKPWVNDELPSGMKSVSSYSQVETFWSTVLNFHGKEKAEHPNIRWVECKWVWLKMMDLTIKSGISNDNEYDAGIAVTTKLYGLFR